MEVPRVTSRATRAAVVLCCAAACAGAHGQAATQAGVAKPPPDVGDEVQVEGHNVAALRAEIQQAEQVFYDRFNAINSRDEFDITCDYQVQTGSKMPRRVCRANFWGVSEAKAAHEGVLRQHGTGNAGSAQFESEARGKEQQLEAEMRGLVATDPELGRAAFRLGALHQALAQQLARSQVPGPEDRPPTTSGQAAPEDAGVTQVKIGAKPWEQALQWRTFTIANASGKLRSVEVHCSGSTERLQWEDGVEWRLPDDWKECGLRVDARAGTTFTLYEFK
jgi:hypothetical protein